MGVEGRVKKMEDGVFCGECNGARNVDMMNSSFLHDKEKAYRYSFRGAVYWRGRVVNKQWFGGQRSQQSIPCFDEVSSRGIKSYKEGVYTPSEI